MARNSVKQLLKKEKLKELDSAPYQIELRTMSKATLDRHVVVSVTVSWPLE